MTHQIKAVLFDLDGVIVFTDKYHYRAWKRLADEMGWAFDEEVNNGCRGVPRLASLKVILDHNKITLPPDQMNALADRKNGYYTESLRTMSRDDICPGAASFLKALKKRGTKLGLCSSSKNADTVLERLGLRRYFDAVVTGNDITHAKPHPEIFLLGAQRLRIPPFHCLVFEDAPSGIQAAAAAGMKSIGVGPAELLSDAPFTIQSYDEIDPDAVLDTGRPRRVKAEPWCVAQTNVEPRRAQYWETLFALSNGFIGLRGAFEEDDETLRPHSCPGMYLNGIYDYEPYHHLWYFPGFATRTHAMLNLADWRIINLIVDGERFSMFSGTVTGFRRALDMKRGVTTRSLVWESPRGARVRIKTTRLVSMARRHNAAIRYEVVPLTPCERIVFESVVHEDVHSGALAGQNHVVRQHRHVSGADADYLFATRDAPFTFSMALTHRVEGPAATCFSVSAEQGEKSLVTRICVPALEGSPIVLEKHAAFFTSIETGASRLVERARDAVAEAGSRGFSRLMAEHAARWKRYWAAADITIDGDVRDQQALRFSLFHLRQSHPEDPMRSISANGMTGDHYCGHVFWDTEMYMAPHFLYTEPEIVKPLLMYRHGILDKARERAAQMQGAGALYSWNSISGEECCVVFEAATAEYHLESAIAYAVWRYVHATGDTDFLHDYGAEILFETARFIAGRGAFIPHKGGKFCINAVCGPDEYGCGVNNNCYTNVMAQWHLRYARDVYETMKSDAPDQLARLTAKINLSGDELELWKRAADNMYIPFNAALGIHEQDDSFLSLDPVDMNAIPRNTDIRELMHPLNLWRMQVAKQADVVLLMFVQGQQFGARVKKRNFEFYEPRTCHGSSLSACIHSIMAAETGRLDLAYDFFRQSARMDLDDFKNNTRSGVHSACLGGTWMAMVNGFAGMRDYPAGLSFSPMLPAAWKGYSFKIRYRGSRIALKVARGGATFTLLSGPAVSVTVRGRKITLAKGRKAVVPVKQ